MPPTSHFLKIHFIIVLPSTPRSSRWSLSFRFPHQNPARASSLSHTCYMPAQLILLYLITPIIFGEQYRSLSSLLCSFLHSLVNSPQYSPQHLILKHHQPTFLPQCDRPSFTPIQNRRQNYTSVYINLCRSQWPRGLRRGFAAARLLRSWVRIPPWAWMFVGCECYMLSGRGLCDELITRPEESYWLRCVVVCDLENLKNQEAMTRVGSQRPPKKKYIYINLYIFE